MRRRATICLLAVLLALCADRAPASPIILTFEGLKNLEQVASYYNAGLGSLGTGPGPNDGITFTSNAVASIPSTPFPNDPSPPTVLLLANINLREGSPISFTMDARDGFTRIFFYDIDIETAGTVQIYSGLDGTGSLLGTLPLPPQPNPLTPVFLGPDEVPFSGVAHSVVFSGGNNQLAFDNITLFSAVPEPSSVMLMALGLGSVISISRRRRPRADSIPL